MLNSGLKLIVGCILLTGCTYSYYGREKPTVSGIEDGKNDYFACLEYQIPKLDDGKSDPLTIATAVYSSCERYFDRWQNLNISAKSLTPSQARNVYYSVMDKASSDMPGKIAVTVLQYRKGRKFDVKELPKLKDYRPVWDY